MTLLSSIDPLRIRKVLDRRDWTVPREFGPAGWSLVRNDRRRSVIVSEAEHEDGSTWIHASVAGDDEVPDYIELVALHSAVFGDRYAYQVFAPAADHVNIHEFALHLWGRADGLPAMPQFGHMGTI